MTPPSPPPASRRRTAPEPTPRPKPALCQRAFQRMLDALGPQHWWPAQTREEVIIGAVLTQNTAWANVEKALANLRDGNALTLRAVADMAPHALAERIRPAGYYNLKTRRLQCVARYFMDRCDGHLDALAPTPTGALRGELLAVHGVGRETADSILLYALDRPVFVIDAYTLRIGARHGWFPPETPYEGARSFFERSLTGDVALCNENRTLPAHVALFNEYHALLVRIGNRHCRPRRPRCEDCPLAHPDCGPIVTLP